MSLQTAKNVRVRKVCHLDKGYVSSGIKREHISVKCCGSTLLLWLVWNSVYWVYGSVTRIMPRASHIYMCFRFRTQAANNMLHQQNVHVTTDTAAQQGFNPIKRVSAKAYSLSSLLGTRSFSQESAFYIRATNVAFTTVKWYVMGHSQNDYSLEYISLASTPA